MSAWNFLPENIFENIQTRLSSDDQFLAKYLCKEWYQNYPLILNLKEFQLSGFDSITMQFTQSSWNIYKKLVKRCGHNSKMVIEFSNAEEVSFSELRILINIVNPKKIEFLNSPHFATNLIPKGIKELVFWCNSLNYTGNISTEAEKVTVQNVSKVYLPCATFLDMSDISWLCMNSFYAPKLHILDMFNFKITFIVVISQLSTIKHLILRWDLNTNEDKYCEIITSLGFKSEFQLETLIIEFPMSKIKADIFNTPAFQNMKSLTILSPYYDSDYDSDYESEEEHYIRTFEDDMKRVNPHCEIAYEEM
ncbi:leucine-rich repeat-containing protein [Tetraselmis virus 1]|uniref:Leucine-rich repeat-containing protein n=1 Tax=Tetraselmis virus 1 TaxID=2060617 RepID=A0A2P0VNN7_9VIRU|nr:leucine-rich repeat-containing protein [Tetraselmis virus 1]AUF82521.1 leucine-rich repeat-containing protein [Tetraselmis virus 1]